MTKLWTITVGLLLVITLGTHAQKKKSLPAKSVKQATVAKKKEASTRNINKDPATDEKKVRDMISFLEFMLNTLGSSSTSARDKDVVVTESYSKLFRDNKVQVEDDLTENRSVITNKDVVAYLKDINFFFKEAKFEFTIDKVERGVNAGNQTFYKVTLTRNLNGVTSEGKPINTISPRFIEVNLDNKRQDLKIVSIYTHEFDEKAALLNWWKQLSFEWQSVFRKQFSLEDSVTLKDIHKIIAIDELNLSSNKYIQSFEALAQLRSLKILNLSGTSIQDLSPIRNLTGMTDLNLSQTAVRDLTPIKYFNNLLKLNISNTEVRDVTVIERMTKLQSLDLSATRITDFSPVWNLSDLTNLNLRLTSFSNLSSPENLTQLIELNISNTSIKDVSSIGLLKNLQILNCDSTRVQNIHALANLNNLKILQANSSLISDLTPLQKLPKLQKIYCDQTQINKANAEAFMVSHPAVSVIYDSRNIRLWWDGLSPAWKKAIQRVSNIGNNPTNEDLTKIGNIDSINVSGTSLITDLEPLHKFLKLQVLIAAQTSVQDLSPIRDHKEIRYLDIAGTHVTDLSPLSHFTKLKILKADRCNIQSIDPLQKVSSLQKLYVDETTINNINAQEFLDANSKCLLIYKTVHLKRWWRNLSDNWKEIFLSHIQDTTRESLHKLVEQNAFHLKDVPVTDLSGLTEFIRLKELHVSGTALSEIIPLENLKGLTSLHTTNSPIQNIESIGSFTNLEDLDISNTPLEDLTPVWTLQKLKNLNCAGTQIRRLEGLEKLEGLQQLDCSNTNVARLTPLDYLKLKSLKCYNTRVSTRTIENFIASHPQCKVVYYR